MATQINKEYVQKIIKVKLENFSKFLIVQQNLGFSDFNQHTESLRILIINTNPLILGQFLLVFEKFALCFRLITKFSDH